MARNTLKYSVQPQAFSTPRRATSGAEFNIHSHQLTMCPPGSDFIGTRYSTPRKVLVKHTISLSTLSFSGG